MYARTIKSDAVSVRDMDDLQVRPDLFIETQPVVHPPGVVSIATTIVTYNGLKYTIGSSPNMTRKKHGLPSTGTKSQTRESDPYHFINIVVLATSY